MNFCDYGCGQEAKFQFKNGKRCCSRTYKSCLEVRKKFSKAKKGIKRGPRPKEVIEKISRNRKGKGVGKKIPRTIEWCERISKSKIGKKRPPASKETRILLSSSSSRSWEERYGTEKSRKLKEIWKTKWRNGFASYVFSFIKRKSKPQVSIFNMAKESFPSAKIDFPFLNFCLDIVIPEYKVVIEYDGWFWHQNEEKDAERQKLCEFYGWKFLRYRGKPNKDIIPSKEQLLLDIQKIVGDR